MAKYCDQCGKPLPDGVEICPECSRAAAQEEEAALFTRMTAETEVWKSAEPVKQSSSFVKKVRSNRGRIILYSGAVVLAALAVFLILFSQPGPRMIRALNRDEVDEAFEIYRSSPRLGAFVRQEKIDAALLAAADRLCTRYADHEIDADSAATLLSKLGGFGEGAAALLEPTYARFRGYNGSQLRMDEAEKLFSDGAYLDAREAYLQVDENDAYYADAQSKAAECLVRYGESVGKEAEALMAEDRYPEAITVLEAGNDKLYEYDTFSEVIDDRLQECRDRYEQFILDEAKALAEGSDYDSALERIRSGMEEFGSERESFLRAEENYAALAREKHIADAKERAEKLYAEEAYGDAFAELEALKTLEEDNEAETDGLITALEQRFTQEMHDRALEIFAGERDDLPNAISILDEALMIREPEELRAFRDELAQYLPLSLIDGEYSGKNGTVFRSDGEFEGLDGSVYSEGWMWGEDGAEICFDLAGNYDELSCIFAMRRKDSANANGWFEVFCDGEQVLKADKLFHWQTEPKSYQVDVSGCGELKLVFHCDYQISTAENGYCYHGLCDIQVTKDLASAPKSE